MIAVSLMASERYIISTFFDTIIPLRGDSGDYNPTSLEHKETEESMAQDLRTYLELFADINLGASYDRMALALGSDSIQDLAEVLARRK